MTVRTRIAPSPTGDPHVGTAYIALFNMCFAKQHGGQFILRIEDTDQERSSKQSEQSIFDALRWLGLDWSEGPDVGGEYGPYRQSERAHIYKQYVDELLENGHAFYCFATPAELDAMRREQIEKGEPVKYDGRGLQLSQADVSRRLAAGEPHVVRMKVPQEGICEFDDMLRGKIAIEWSQIDMQVLMKADGMPTYHLANIVDDHLMKVTHVIRGEEWINSTPKHKLLYEYLGWDMPTLCHLPLLRNPDKSKLSKRKNPTSIRYYQRMGYLPEALVNYMGRMGWSMPDERERFTVQEMVDHFDISRVSLGGPIFDTEKLDWLNGQWLREALSVEQFADALQQWAFNKDYLMPILPHLQSRIEKLSDIASLAGFYFAGMLNITEAHFQHKKLDKDGVIKLLQFALWRLEVLSDWNRESIFAEMKRLSVQMELKVGELMPPLFVAIAGTTESISVVDSMALLGPDISRARIRHAINVLGGCGKKKLKKLEKEYDALDRLECN